MKYPHQPVLLGEVVRTLITEPEGIYVDGTVGSGGHSEAIGEKIEAKGRLICLDRDTEAIRISKGRLTPHGELRALTGYILLICAGKQVKTILFYNGFERWLSDI